MGLTLVVSCFVYGDLDEEVMATLSDLSQTSGLPDSGLPVFRILSESIDFSQPGIPEV